MLRCGQNEIGMSSARGSYMKRQPPRLPQQSRLPRWAIGTGQLSCLQFRSGPIARRGGGRRYITIWLRVYDPIFVVFARTCGYKKE